MEGSDRGRGSGGSGASKSWSSDFRGGSSPCPGCGDGTVGVSLSDLGFMDDLDLDKKAKTKSKKKRERKARAKDKRSKKGQDEEVAAVVNGGACNGHIVANGHAGEKVGAGGHSNRQANKTQPTQRPKSRPACNFTGSHDHIGGDISAKSQQQAAARQRAGSSGMETAGSLLSMLDEGGGLQGRDGGQADGEDGDEGIDEDLVREMERLRIQKAQTDVQRTRAALRSNLQKNFDQLLVSSTVREPVGDTF